MEEDLSLDIKDLFPEEFPDDLESLFSEEIEGGEG